MIEIVVNRCSLAVLDKDFGRQIAEGGDRLAAVSGMRLPFTTGPEGDPVDDFGLRLENGIVAVISGRHRDSAF